MTVHNEIQYGTGPLRAIRLGTGMGEGDGVVRLGESWLPVVDWYRHPDWAILANEKLQGARVTPAAGGAGIRSMCALPNADGSGRIFIVEHVQSNATVIAFRALAPAPVAGVGGWANETNASVRDFRDSAPPRVMSNVTVAAAAGGTLFYQIPAGAGLALPIIIGPNNALVLDPGADNTSFTVSIAWRERVLLPGEPPKR